MTSPSHAPDLFLSARRLARPRGLAVVVLAGALVFFLLWRARPPADPEVLWKIAEAEVNEGRAAPARRGLEQILRLRAPTTADWMLQGQIEVAEDNRQAALGSLARIPDQDPLAAQAAYMIGRIERERDRMRFAEEAYDRAVRLMPGLVPAHREKLYILGMQLRRKEVDAQFKRLSRLTQLNHHDLFTWGLTHFTVWGPDSASELERFIAADPADRASRLALATMLIDQPGEEERVEKVLAPLPDSDPDALTLRAELMLNHNQIDEAVAILEKVTAPSRRMASLKGRIELRKGNAEQAIRDFERALTDEPYDRVTIADLAKALVLKGDRAAADRYFARARKLDAVYNLLNRISRPNQENQAPDLKNLGRVCEEAGLLDEAKGWYTLAISRDPLDEDAQRALHRLKEALAKGETGS